MRRLLTLLALAAALVWPPTRAAVAWTIGATFDVLGFLLSARTLTVIAGLSVVVFVIVLVATVVLWIRRRRHPEVDAIDDLDDLPPAPAEPEPGPAYSASVWTVPMPSFMRGEDEDRDEHEQQFDATLRGIRELPEAHDRPGP